MESGDEREDAQHTRSVAAVGGRAALLPIRSCTQHASSAEWNRSKMEQCGVRRTSNIRSMAVWDVGRRGAG